MDRRRRLLKLLQEQNPDVEHAMIVLFAAFEENRYKFRQDSSFYYFTGIEEPGVVFCMDWQGREFLFVPSYGQQRNQWVACTLQPDPSMMVKDLGKPCNGYSLKPFFSQDAYENLIQELRKQGTIFTLLDRTNQNYFIPIYRFENILLSLPKPCIKDISPLVASMRRRKDELELSCIKRAIDVTSKAYNSVIQKIKPGMYEYEVRAELERVFEQYPCAFPTIVATGKNSTVLHYTSLTQRLSEGDLVVIDSGAEVGLYCADITRTYPVSKKFTAEQKTMYERVLEVQRYVFSIAKPGMYLNNPHEPELSLHHLAKKFLQDEARYFVHGIGHFLGLDVHDVGDPMIPLAPGDVFTIEPGIYIPEKHLGIRIEDDFLITPSGCSCLSENLTKSVQSIEAMQ